MSHKENLNTYLKDLYFIKCKVIDDIKSLIKELSNNDEENPCVVVEDIYGCDTIINIDGYVYTMKKIYNSEGKIYFIAENIDDSKEKRFNLCNCKVTTCITIYHILIYYKECIGK